MIRLPNFPRKAVVIVILALIGIGSGFVLSSMDGGGTGPVLGRRPIGPPQLISIEPLPEMDAEMCQWIPASANTSLILPWQEVGGTARTPSRYPEASERAEVAKRAPLRVIKDPYSAYSSIAVDPVHNEVVMTDESLFNVLVYDRLTNTPPTATMSEPKSMIGGLKTKIEFQCGLYIDPANGDIYAVNNDTVDTLVIFNREAQGDVPPTRELRTPHGTFGITVDEERQEMFLTVQHDNAVVVYTKTAEKRDAPIRLLQGNRTRMADPHGITVDTTNDLIFVTNHGSVSLIPSDPGPRTGTLGRGEGIANWPIGRDHSVPGSGEVRPSSITVYPRTASGDTPPLRVIEGPKTQLNWPSGIAVDPKRGELYVANDAGDSILAFPIMANGNVEPIRVLKGPKSGIKNPTGLFLDTKNDELWVANFGNHTATVYKPTAGGDAPPLRTIRSAPLGKPSLMIGNPGALAYDSKREEILVPN